MGSIDVRFWGEIAAAALAGGRMSDDDFMGLQR
jgi:hypothetical protein